MTLKDGGTFVELAEVGDGILGTGGSSKQSAGHGKLIYLMHVDEKPTFEAFLADRRFRGHSDWADFGNGNKFALVSERYFYFGKNALSIADLPKELTPHLIKKGPRFRRDCPKETIMAIVERMCRKYKGACTVILAESRILRSRFVVGWDVYCSGLSGFHWRFHHAIFFNEVHTNPKFADCIAGPRHEVYIYREMR